MQQVVIVGGGQSGAQVAVELRRLGHPAPIHIIAEEPELPYQRPPLSKQYLQGQFNEARLRVKPAEWWGENNVTVHTDSRALALDLDGRRVQLDGAGWVSWSHLVLATGVEPVRLPIEGADLEGVHYLRTRHDSDRLREALGGGGRLVVIGGGYIGLEVAAVAVEAGLRVELVELAERILQRVTSPFISEFYTRLHSGRGAVIHTGTGVERLIGEAGRITGVVTSSGQTLPADAAVIGVGVRPRVELAEAAGLPCDNGICVDEFARTPVAGVYACGDCSSHPNALLGARLRLESVPNALEQARTVAADIAGSPAAYSQIPWFWSDQYDVKLQLAGLVRPEYDGVLRGDVDAGEFLYFYLDAERRVRAVEAVNRPREFLALRRALHRFPRVEDPSALAEDGNDYLDQLTAAAAG
ncbi:MAG: FAD-dependent oxidoreductase [Gammaproteobacteria bacterium AqS3]|nr:FAD-dependent oxidoreductase [Gammaproteobacteria bacterium AqS3]